MRAKRAKLTQQTLIKLLNRSPWYFYKPSIGSVKTDNTSFQTNPIT